MDPPITSRTPEDWRTCCPICGKPLEVMISHPARDTVCPHCGSLLFFDVGWGREGADGPRLRHLTHLPRVRRVLEEIIKLSQARCALLITSNGEVLCGTEAGGLRKEFSLDEVEEVHKGKGKLLVVPLSQAEQHVINHYRKGS